MHSQSAYREQEVLVILYLLNNFKLNIRLKPEIQIARG